MGWLFLAANPRQYLYRSVSLVLITAGRAKTLARRVIAHALARNVCGPWRAITAKQAGFMKLRCRRFHQRHRCTCCKARGRMGPRECAVMNPMHPYY